MSGESGLLIYPIRLFFPCHWLSHSTYRARILTGRFIETLSWRNASFYLSFSFLIFIFYFFIQQKQNYAKVFLNPHSCGGCSKPRAPVVSNSD